MTQKQIISIIIGILVLGLMFVFVYRQFAVAPQSAPEQMKSAVSQSAKKTEEPKTIDDISRNIQDETTLDLSAIDDEANGEISDIQSDSDSVNDLGTSYAENSL